MNVKLVSPCYVQGTVLGCRARAVIHTETVSALRTYLLQQCVAHSRCWGVERVLFRSLPPSNTPADRGVLAVLSPPRLGNSYSSSLSTFLGGWHGAGCCSTGVAQRDGGLALKSKTYAASRRRAGQAETLTTAALTLPLAQAGGCCVQ